MRQAYTQVSLRPAPGVTIPRGTLVWVQPHPTDEYSVLLTLIGQQTSYAVKASAVRLLDA